MRHQDLLNEIKGYVLEENDADDTLSTIQRSIDENIDLAIGSMCHDDIYEVARDLGLVDFSALQGLIFEKTYFDAEEIRDELEDKVLRCDWCNKILDSDTYIGNSQGSYCNLNCLKATLEIGNFYVNELNQTLQFTESEYNEIHGN
jgi:hypothetical protein